MSPCTDPTSLPSVRAPHAPLFVGLLLLLIPLGAPPAVRAQDGLVIVSDVVPNSVEPAVPRVLLDLAIPGPNNASVFEDLVEDFLSPVPPELINDDGRACIEGWSSAYAAGFLSSMVTPPLTDYGFSSAAYYANLALKKCTPLFLRPPDVALEPNSADGCRYESAREPTSANRVQRMHEKRGFFFQLDSPLPSPHDEDWGRSARPT